MNKLKIESPSHIMYNIATNTCEGLDSNWTVSKIGPDPARETIILLSRLTGTKNAGTTSDNFICDYYYSDTSCIRIEPKGYQDTKEMKLEGPMWEFDGDAATCKDMAYQEAYTQEQ